MLRISSSCFVSSNARARTVDALLSMRATCSARAQTRRRHLPASAIGMMRMSHPWNFRPGSALVRRSPMARRKSCQYPSVFPERFPRRFPFGSLAVPALCPCDSHGVPARFLRDSPNILMMYGKSSKWPYFFKSRKITKQSRKSRNVKNKSRKSRNTRTIMNNHEKS